MAKSSVAVETASSVCFLPPNVLRYLGFGASLLGMLLAGSVYSFNAFSDATKSQLDFSQSQVEWLMSIGVISTCIGLTAGMINERCGPHLTCCLAALFTGCGYWLFGLAAEKAIPHGFVTLCFIFFLSGQGSVFFYMIALVNTATNFPVRVRATLFGLLDSLYGGSAVIWSTIYNVMFGQSDDPLRQNLAGYLYMLAIAGTFIGLLMFVLVHHLPHGEESESSGQEDSSLNSTSQLEAVGDASEDPSAAHVSEHHSLNKSQEASSEAEPLLSSTSVDDGREQTLKQLFCSLNFHLLFWPFLAITSITTMFGGNITFYLKSAYLEDEYRKPLTIMIPAIGLLGRIFFGFTSDRLQKRVPRTVFILVSSVLMSVGFILLRIDVGKAWVLTLNSVLVPLAAGAMWTLSPTIISEASGKHFGLNWGVIMFASGFVTILFQFLFGIVYDDHTAKSSTTRPTSIPAAVSHLDVEKQASPTPATCYGAACYSFTSDVMLACCWLSIASLLTLVVRQLHEKVRQPTAQ